jgi:hypothetical protein
MPQIDNSATHIIDPFQLIPGLLISIGKTSREVLMSKEPKKYAMKHPLAFSDDLYFGYRSEIKN